MRWPDTRIELWLEVEWSRKSCRRGWKCSCRRLGRTPERWRCRLYTTRQWSLLFSIRKRFSGPQGTERQNAGIITNMIANWLKIWCPSFIKSRVEIDLWRQHTFVRLYVWSVRSGHSQLLWIAKVIIPGLRLAWCRTESPIPVWKAS